MKKAKWKWRNSTVVLLISVAVYCLHTSTWGATIAPRNHAVEMRATVQAAPPKIRLEWVPDTNATKYIISRKDSGGASWTKLGELSGNQNHFEDTNVAPGRSYEYQAIRETALGYTGYGYLFSGIEVPFVEDRGRVILVVENRAAELEQELARFEQDLAGDGWTVARFQVSATNRPPEVRARIQEVYAQDPQNTKAVLLFGHVPVPYSGNITPDEHDNHRGAWPADVYYGDLDGVWSDVQVNNKESAKSWNWNVPGDGKFDQSLIPTKVELAVGRVDLSNLTCFANKIPARGELDLLKGYLEKNHRFRHGQMNVDRRSILYDRQGLTLPEALSAFAWRSHSSLVGTNILTVKDNQWFPTTRTNTFLIGSAIAGGSFIESNGLGTSDDYAIDPVNVVFVTMVGSYYGDWDNESNLLRAALASSGSILTTCYGGKPQWLFQPMGIGGTIGEVLLLAQTNSDGGQYPPFNPGAGMIHISLLGDPTLRLVPVPPPGDLAGRAEGNTMSLTWGASAASGLRGYHIYKSRAQAPFSRVTTRLITATEFQDPNYLDGDAYMVRAFVLSETASGSFWNASQGLFYPDFLRRQTAETPPASPSNLGIDKVRADSISIKWVVNSFNHTGFIIERKAPGATAFQEHARTAASAESFTDTSLPTAGIYTYRVRSFNNAGVSAPSNETAGSNTPGVAVFLKETAGTGNWSGKFGAAGYHIFDSEPKYPQDVSLTPTYFHFFNYNTNDTRFPQSPAGAGRSSVTMVSSTTGHIDVKLADGKPRMITFYMLDKEPRGRSVSIQPFDMTGSATFASNVVSNFGQGRYVSYLVEGSIRFTFRSLIYGENITVFGIFLDDPALPQAAINPDGGAFAGRTTVRLSSPFSSDIFYSLDGSDPLQSSRRYTGPFELGSSAVVRARIIRPGYAPGPVTESTFINTLVNRGGFISRDTQTRGNWPDVFGKEGFMVRLGATQLPAYATASFEGNDQWIWSESTDDGRAPFTDRTKTRRVSAVWYAPDEFYLNLKVIDVKSHALSLYFLDWDRAGRKIAIQATDPDGNVLQDLTVTDFENGAYLTLNIQGHIRLRFKKIAGPNVVLNGLFFDGAPAELNQPIPIKVQNTHFSNGELVTSVSGDPGLKICLDYTTDCQTWNHLGPQYVLDGVARFRDSGSTNAPFRFYRAHTVQ